MGIRSCMEIRQVPGGSQTTLSVIAVGKSLQTYSTPEPQAFGWVERDLGAATVHLQPSLQVYLFTPSVKGWQPKEWVLPSRSQALSVDIVRAVEAVTHLRRTAICGSNDRIDDFSTPLGDAMAYPLLIVFLRSHLGRGVELWRWLIGRGRNVYS